MGPGSPNAALELVSLAAAGDPMAQRRLIDRLQRRVHGISLAILGNASDAEDTTQTGLLEILKSAGTFRGENLLAWADRIAVRTAIRQARQRRIRAMQYEGRADLDDVAGRVEESSFEDAIPHTLVEYLALLPEARRVVVVLRHVMEYSIEEIAELTEVSPNTVKDRLLNARAQLRRLIRRDLSLADAGRQKR